MKKGNKKGQKGKKENSSSSNQGKKGKGKQQQKNHFPGSAEASTGGDELSSKLETHFSMVSCLSSNTMSGVRRYVDNGAPNI